MYRGEFHSIWPLFPWKLTAGIFFSVMFSLIIINIGLTMEKKLRGRHHRSSVYRNYVDILQ